jgi:hypothetical protein
MAILTAVLELLKSPEQREAEAELERLRRATAELEARIDRLEAAGTLNGGDPFQLVEPEVAAVVMEETMEVKRKVARQGVPTLRKAIFGFQ